MNTFIVVAMLYGVLVGTVLTLLELRLKFSGKSLRWEDKAFSYRVKRDRGGGVVSVSLAIEMPDTLRFVLRRECWYDALGKASGLAREWQTEDRDFDLKVFISCEDREFLQALSGSGELRRQVSELLDVDGRRITAYGGQLWIRLDGAGGWDRSSDNDAIALSTAAEQLPKLLALRERLVAVHADLWSAERDPGLGRQQLMRWICVLAGVAGIAGAIQLGGTTLPYVLVHEQIIRHAIAAAFVGVLALSALLIMLIGRTSRTHILFLHILLIAAPGIGLAAAAFYNYLDIQLDRTEPTPFSARVANKYTTTHKGTRSYHLVVDHWQDARFSPTLDVEHGFYADVNVGNCVRFELYPGAFGDPWLESYAVVPSAACTSRGITP